VGVKTQPLCTGLLGSGREREPRAWIKNPSERRISGSFHPNVRGEGPNGHLVGRGVRRGGCPMRGVGIPNPVKCAGGCFHM
jgi:hypothetical protein